MSTRNFNITLKYQEIISRSIRISSGSPSVYQLKPKKEKTGSLTRMTVGERNMNKTNRTILLVGETGSGKSTLINSLFNYTMGVKFEDKVWFQIVDEEGRSQSESQTLDVIVYQIFGFEDKTLPYSLTIIDTPGYNSTRGIKKDSMISQKLFDLFRSKDGVHEVDAVGLVMKASDNRLSDRLMYVLNSVTSLFGKDLEKNIVALITHSDARRPENVLKALEAAKIKCAKNEKNQPVYFLFNNCQDEERTEEEEEEFLEVADKISVNGMRALTTFLEKTAPQKLMKTVNVLKERIILTACIQNMEERIKLTEMKQRNIKQINEAVKKHEEEMKKNGKFIVEVDEVYKEREPIGGGMCGLPFTRALCCTVCEENCHYPCKVGRKPKDCEVMYRGRCTVCTNKCPASAHVKETWKYVTETNRVQKTSAEMKQMYEKNKSEKWKKLRLLENLEKEMNQLTSEKSQRLDEAYQHVVNLEQIALNVDSVSTHVHLDFLIDKMKERGDREKVQKLERIKNRVDEGTRAALKYMKTKQDLENKLKTY
ncbi:septin-2-like [Mugil cephalus]|uniref:septin-2-like n=1 Tax=Mugil cephalus TaxID=48193 RepID=UPI001FB77EB1|nr:septin-2-like [Mugil cephalus]XP_047425071.1 septin-2-like [Mugil cephalus]